MISVKAALTWADKLCPPNHPSGHRVLFTVSSPPTKARKGPTKVEIDHQLKTAEAIGALAAEVRRLRARERARRKKKAAP